MAIGPKKIDDGSDTDSPGRRNRVGSVGLRGSMPNAIRREDADARYGREPPETKPFRKGGKVRRPAKKK